MTQANPAGGFLDLELPVEVWLAAEEVPLEKLVDLQPGGVLSLAKDPESPVDLVVNGTVVASGDLVVVEGRFGIRVTTTSLQMLSNLEPDPGGQARP